VRGVSVLCPHLIVLDMWLSSSIGVLLAVMVPRVPSFSFNSSAPLARATGSWNASIPTYFSRAPANFSFPAFASLQVNTGSNFLPLTFNHVFASVTDLQTGRLVASGDLGHKTLPAKSFPHIMLPLNFTYIASNDTDQTCMFYVIPERLILTQ
jgi:hypothetical protein